jgi:hypothetical protein
MTSVATTESRDLGEPEVVVLVQVIATEFESVGAELNSLVPAGSDKT